MDYPTRLSKRPSLGYLKAITKKKSFMLFSTSATISNPATPEDQRSPPKPAKPPQPPPHKASFYHSAIVDATNREDSEPIRRSLSLQHQTPDHQTYGKEGLLPSPLLLHEKYHHLKKMKKVGKGGSATIYLLTRLPTFTEFFQTPPFRKKHTVPYTVLAIKRHHRRNPDEESQMNFEKRLKQEFIITKTLQHSPHVITVFELLKDRRGRWCTVMDYCGGGDVLTLLQQVDLTSEAMDCVFKQLLRGLGDLHEQGIVHRDIKPDNLLMTQAGVLKITDFGVAQQGVLCQGICGSTPYWPPELFMTLEYDGQAMDVWSAAVTFYCLLYGRIPFFQANLQDPQYATFLKQRPEWWALSQCPADLQEVILAMLHPDPTQRWQIPRCLASPWVQSIDVCYDHPRHPHHRHHHL